ncbi:hypothetical protein A4H02_07640 [Fervidobacterium thailandense]|uniref:Uncharacterized protein n=1 Tax=Fervidobacterium thailandense TaxID=1008305 RepID=A0A1E3G1I3_9BACT|nr:hypothetical protein [Fervidobacterium thailandense]ODN30042.1 hypothetical protein A4H02_07640 [Fervidobacterium thailandense]
MKLVTLATLVLLSLTLVFASFYLDVSTVKVGETNYIVYEFGPEFNIGPVLIGLTLTTYTSDISTGTFYFGTPSTTPSTNIIDGLNITALGLDLGTVWFRYGQMQQLTYGMGLVMNGYYLPRTRTLDLGARLDNFKISAHVPYEIKQLTTLNIQPSDSVYSALILIPLLGLDLSVYGVMETDERAQLQHALGTALTKNILGFSVGVEAATQFWKSGQMSYGGFAGLFGDFGIFQLVAGPYYASDGFVVWLLNREYGNLRYTYDPSNYSQRAGYIVRASLNVQSYGRLVVSLSGDFQSNPTLIGEGYLRIPQVGGTNGLILYAYMFDNTPFGNGQLLDENTSARITMAYPLLDNLFAGIKYTWNGSEFQQTAFVGGMVNF